MLILTGDATASLSFTLDGYERGLLACARAPSAVEVLVTGSTWAATEKAAGQKVFELLGGATYRVRGGGAVALYGQPLGR